MVEIDLSLAQKKKKENGKDRAVDCTEAFLPYSCALLLALFLVSPEAL